MAREWALAGVKPEELQPDTYELPPQTPQEKFQNFWFYYKWWVFAAVAALLIIGVAVWQTVTTVQPDYPIALVTRDPVEEIGLENLNIELAKYGKDLNGDGQVVVDVENLALSQYAGGRKNSMAETNSQKIMAYLASADVMFFIFDEDCYENYLTDLAETAPDGIFYQAPSVEAAGISEAGYWNWADDRRHADFWGAEFPENLYFGVRRMGGTAEGERVQARFDADMALLEAYLTDTPTTTEPTA